MKISIITPSYNSGKYLERAIESVLAQDYSDWEHIVVDGGSNDHTVDILKKYAHIRWISEPDRGQSDAMNKGFDLSTGDVIVYLNADDEFSQGTFSKVINCLNQEHKDMVFGDLKILHEVNHTEEIRTPATAYSEIIKFWDFRFPANPVSYFYRRKVQEQYRFPIQNHCTMDLEFLFYASKFHSISYLPHTFGTFYLDGENKTSKMDTHREKEKAYLNHCRQYNRFLYLKYFLSKLKQTLISRS